MSWVDDFTTDYFTSVYTTFTGPPDSLSPHALTTNAGDSLIWLDERNAQLPLFDVEADVVAGGSEPAICVFGCITTDLRNGFYAGPSSEYEGYLIAVTDVSDLDEGIISYGTAAYPDGDFTIKVTMTAAGLLTLAFGANTFTATVTDALMAALAARTLYPIGYVNAGEAPVVISEWRYGGGAASSVSVGAITSGVRKRGVRA